MTIVDAAKDPSCPEGENLIMVVCAICGAERGEDYNNYSTHFAGHTWDDLEEVLDEPASRRRQKVTA